MHFITISVHLLNRNAIRVYLLEFLIVFVTKVSPHVTIMNFIIGNDIMIDIYLGVIRRRQQM